jgi:hypothetical protein
MGLRLRICRFIVGRRRVVVVERWRGRKKEGCVRLWGTGKGNWRGNGCYEMLGFCES